jgi:predicted house-cleaning noncanonical NTP pyrophosphatase (MazG superfamily)
MPKESSSATAYRKSSRPPADIPPPACSTRPSGCRRMLAKLQEESDELRAAASPAEQSEELADVLEVLKAIASELGQPWHEVESTAAEKRAERGGFEAGIWLEL